VRRAAALALALAAGPAFADETRAGLRAFARNCAVCHAVVAPGGDVVVAGGETGPNLWGVLGRRMAGDAAYARYGDALGAAGETGAVWTAPALDAYLADPAGFLVDLTSEPAARSRMAFRLDDAQARADVIAWLGALR
jgi:cytochrome c